MIVHDTPLWSLTIVVDQNHKKKIEKNLTLLSKFSIMYIESERDDSPLDFATIASKGLKVIHMV